MCGTYVIHAPFEEHSIEVSDIHWIIPVADIP